MDLATLFIVGFVGAITPGPDILLVLRNTLRFGTWHGIKALCGIATGWLLFLSLIYFGFAYILSGDIFQFILSLVGGVYLLYVALCLMRSKGGVEFETHTQNTETISESSLDSETLDSEANPPTNTPSIAPAGFYKALFVNLSNPKAILFFSIMIAPFMDKHLEISLLVLFASLSSAFLSVILLATWFSKYMNNVLFAWIDRVCSVLFAFFAFLLLYRAIWELYPKLQNLA